MPKEPAISDPPSRLRRCAETRLRDRRKARPARAAKPRSATDTGRLLHELEVHQIELEIQNAELQNVRNELETALEKYTDLYEFAPVGYCSIDESGNILETNLAGAALLGVPRSRLLSRRLPLFVSASSRPAFQDFLKKAFTGSNGQTCEAQLLKQGGGALWADFRATIVADAREMRKSCRIVFADITARRQAGEAQRRAQILADTNRGLTREIARREAVEQALRKSRQQQSELLKQSQHMQAQLRHLSHLILHAQEEERKKISRELHDVIAQNLVGINVHLAPLKLAAALRVKGLDRNLAQTQRLIEKLVNIIHRFARELHPAVLDDLGLVPAMHSFMKGFTKQTGIHVHFASFTSGKIKQLDADTSNALYRITQEALTNVARHAHANRVEVSLRKLSRHICLQIKDDGRSFNVERTLHARRGKHLGLLGMRERLEMVGGHFEIASAPGSGTTITAQIPFGRGRRRGLKDFAAAGLEGL